MRTFLDREGELLTVGRTASSAMLGEGASMTTGSWALAVRAIWLAIIMASSGSVEVTEIRMMRVLETTLRLIIWTSWS